METIPDHAWSRKFDAKEPSTSVHAQFTPDILEAISLLPIAYRIGSYIQTERGAGRDPIFDLHGITLSPPHPGPHAGAPCGGMGGGGVGRGFKGEFRRWSLYPGRYHHHIVEADCFAIRIKRAGKVYATVLKPAPPSSPTSPLSSWTHSLPSNSGTYHACFPLSWTVYEDPLPELRVIIKQVSPFIPHNYSESSLPTVGFEVIVENKSSQPTDVSVMFVFQNGIEQFDYEVYEDYKHVPFRADTSSEILGVCMPHKYKKNVCAEQQHNNSMHFMEDKGSFCIAASGDSMSYCRKFISNVSSPSSSDCFYNSFSGMCGQGGGQGSADGEDLNVSAQELWDGFMHEGSIRDIRTLPKHTDACIYASAVCSKCTLPAARVQGQMQPASPSACHSFKFSLAWDHPVARFGTGEGMPRFYTKFFGTSGHASPLLCSYALQNMDRWEREVIDWQQGVHEKIDAYTQGLAEEEKRFYYSQLFNELYFLVDGGTVWLDSNEHRHDVGAEMRDECMVEYEGSILRGGLGEAKESFVMIRERGHQGGDSPAEAHVKLPSTAPAPSSPTSSLYVIPSSTIATLHQTLARFNPLTHTCTGESAVMGRFLYVEGHEYVMYNTYDVHFYASFALCMCFPCIEYGIQREFALAVDAEDLRERVMMGEGTVATRKVKGCLPHDLGSPSESPYTFTNAYNFQDVCRWKDLGPKFILQVYRDYVYMCKRHANSQTGFADSVCASDIVYSTNISAPVMVNKELDSPYTTVPTTSTEPSTPSTPQPLLDHNHTSSPPAHALSFLTSLHPTLKIIMHNMLMFDTDGDGMIENEGFPDQTYDVWVATGVSAYCGGLWVTACEAYASVCTLVGDTTDAREYKDMAQRARQVYIRTLWNGVYVEYDSSNRTHHDSIMADMMVGQWYAHTCHLPALLPQHMATSCLQTIHKYNVVEFGKGRCIGAVNGMRPPVYNDAPTSPPSPTTPPSNSPSSPLYDKLNDNEGDGYGYGDDSRTAIYPATVDSTCIQSREVWTGTTYALAACMLQEAQTMGHANAQKRAQLVRMAFHTAKGVGVMGWGVKDESSRHKSGDEDCGAGYWFATPEAWFRNGNYRSMGYMRPLAIWAMQYAMEMV